MEYISLLITTSIRYFFYNIYCTDKYLVSALYPVKDLVDYF